MYAYIWQVQDCPNGCAMGSGTGGAPGTGGAFGTGGDRDRAVLWVWAVLSGRAVASEPAASSAAPTASRVEICQPARERPVQLRERGIGGRADEQIVALRRLDGVGDGARHPARRTPPDR